MRLELVRDWMSRDVLTVGPDTPLAEAGHLLVSHNIRRLPVVDAGQLVGILTYGDIRGARSTVRQDIDDLELVYIQSRMSVRDLMSAPVITVGEDQTIGQAAQLMLENKIGGIPVLNSHGELVGILTESDVFRLVVHNWMRAGGNEAEPYAHYG